MADPVENPVAPSPRRRTGLLAVSVLLALAGAPTYIALMEHAWLRRTGVAAFLPMLIGTVGGLVVLRSDSRRWARIAALAPGVLTVLWTLAFFVGGRVPPPQPAFAASVAPDFELPDPSGRAVSLRAELARGPVLLVFYRGFW